MTSRGAAWEPPSAPDYGLGGSHGFPDDFSQPEAPEPPAKGSAGRYEWERTNSVVYHAWQEFGARLREHQADYHARTGRELSEQQVTDHRHRFARMMRRAYGIAFADPRWVDEHNQWQDRR